MKHPTCHPNRRHYARGLCRACYDRVRRPPQVITRPCAVCDQAFVPAAPHQRYCGKRCEMRAYRERRKARETAPRCRVCGFGVDLLPVPQDAGGGHLCRYCVDEGLRRAA